MRTALNILIALLVVAHLLSFVLEAIIWETDLAASARETLRFTGPQNEVAKVGKNQGLCNAFLAAGLAWGLRAYRTEKPGGKPVLRFFLGFIAIAGRRRMADHPAGAAGRGRFPGRPNGPGPGGAGLPPMAGGCEARSILIPPTSSTMVEADGRPLHCGRPLGAPRRNR
jgi:uncharacterized membrane protein